MKSKKKCSKMFNFKTKEIEQKNKISIYHLVQCIMEATSKTRTPSRCREWERQRRNKFNDAITRLGEAVRAIHKVNDSNEKDTENVQLPKIEIVQKAIVCLTNCAQEKTQLKAEILALQVKIEAASINKTTKKDASTQAHISFIKKNQNEKYLKLLMLKKSKRNALKEKSVLTTNATVESEAKKGSKYLVNNVTPPKILPKCDIMAKKRTENTIVVLPAAPYLFPQRPLFLPAVPPAFVIVDPNMQTLNKPSVPVVNRTVGDTTKTTMVNILPISAYSRPLSASKAKKTNMKVKCNIQKKYKKKSKTTSTVKEPAAVDTEISMTNESSKDKKKDVEMLVPDKSKEVLVSNTSSQCVITPPKTVTQTKTDNNAHTNKENDEVVSKNKETIDSSKVMETSNNNSAEITENVDINQKSLPLTQTNQSEIHKEVNICIKTTSVEDKDKENKLPNILDTALCENGVDGGNARLELAEEFLAASPTAAFLMSFPLVSGNRADSPADDTSNAIQPNIKENATAQLAIPPPSTDTYFEKPNSTDIKTKAILKQLPASSNTSNKQPSQHKYVDNNAINKPAEIKSSNSIPITNVSTDNPFLSLTMPSIIITTTQPDTFTLDFDCSMSKTVPSQSSSYVTSSNLFYKSDPFSNVKSTIYSTSSIASGHEFNTLGLYPCAMEKYSKNKSDYTNVEDNLMKIGSSSANIMSGSYASAPFTGDFMDYNQPECNYNNNKYEEFKMRSNSSVFQDKVPSNYKSSRRDSGAKHKLECSKKESSKKYQNKRAKLSNEVEEWSDSSNLFWQNKGQNKKHPNLMSEEFTFANYVGNQMAPQYQHELFNSHLVGGMQPGPGGDRSLASFPATSRANFNLSTIFPEITMVSIVYLNAPTKDFSRLANAIITAVREKQISVLRIESYQHSYHFIDTQENYTLNPFLDIVRKTYKDTRIYVSVGNYYDHLGLMMALDAMQLLDSDASLLLTMFVYCIAIKALLKLNKKNEKHGNGNQYLLSVLTQQDSSATGNGNAMVIVSGNPEKSGGSAGGVRSSQVSLSSNPDLDFRYSAIFTEVALYRGRLLSVKRIRRHQIDITREIKKELKIYHGALRPSNCLVDARWVVKLADFGLRAFRAGELPPTEPNDIRSHIDSLVYLAPELLRAAGWGDAAAAEPCEGSPAADVYAFALVLYEMHTRRGPFGADAPPGPALLRRLATAQPTPYRPPVDVLTAQFDCSRECCVECWAEEPALRPDFKAIRTRLRPLRKGMKPNIFDNMIAMMEKYANNLEVLVDERTDQLQEEKKKTEALLEEMLPVPVAEQLKRGHRVMPESYDSVTIYFSDIVGFTAMSAESTPLQVVDFLNDLYTCFDSILENFDVYKVETIGDAYMVVSGLPIRNGIMHAGEVASMALALLSATQSFRVRHRPDQRLLLRVGIHSGPVCAGVVGLKMPRYCLFGDTVNTASRFESTGAPLKIHCSSTCKGLLDKLGGYILEERGIVAMKGKRDQVTYWLKGEEKETAAARAHRRAQAEGASQLAAEKRGQRSSLKNKSWKNQIGVLHRCCSLESPKKLRFASGNLLELSHTDSVLHHRSDEYLMEVIGDSRLAPAQRGDLLEAPSLRHEHTSVSCPIIEHTETSPVPLATNSCATLPHDHKRTKPCDIKLVVNGCSYNENEAGIPLLADA
ncbi:hypothetical protein MSG28_003502 [Choristoneura fumiferana]|uniref:Uncharacterized protein n=1 Tax=Choristoneura fumiferana TaxID=7141 RepID=A0ACC0KFL8_CHOFU|nr:hypothetical protein MSG28_003502 [Choristoneura fumiferana]